MCCSGYRAPEYVKHGEISGKTDVYSFDIVVLEIMSGKKNSHFSSQGNLKYLLGYVSSKLRISSNNLVSEIFNTSPCTCEIIKPVYLLL